MKSPARPQHLLNSQIEIKFEDFAQTYKEELEYNEENLKNLRAKAKRKTVSLLYGAKDTVNNQAVVLKKVLQDF